MGIYVKSFKFVGQIFVVCQFFTGLWGPNFVDLIEEGGVETQGKLDFIWNDYLSLQRLLQRSIFEFSMIRYIDNVILLYANDIREKFSFDRINKKAIAIFLFFI